MLVSQPLVVPSNLPDDAVFPRACRTFSLVLGKASMSRSEEAKHGFATARRPNVPLVIAMVAHEVNAW